MSKNLYFMLYAVFLMNCSTETKTEYVYPDSSGDDVEQNDILEIYQDQVTEIEQSQEVHRDQAFTPDQYEDSNASNDTSSIEDADMLLENQDAPKTETLVHVNTWPEGAETYIDGEPIDRTPFDIVLAFGSYEFTFKIEGYNTHIEVFEINEDTTEVVVILEEATLVPVTFTSNPPQVQVCVNDRFCSQEYTTDFTYDLYSNSENFVYSRKRGYHEKRFDFWVGTEPMDFEIVLDPIDFEAYCGWLEGQFEYIGGAVPPNEIVTTTVETAGDNCQVCGLEPPAPEGVCLAGEYNVENDKIELMCPDVTSCLTILCATYPDTEIIDCTYQITPQGDEANIQWSKIN